VRRSDFRLARFRRSDDRIASAQVVSTLVPILLLWWLVGRVLSHPLGLIQLALAPLLTLLVLFSSRSFALMHDCGHDVLFRDRRLNRVFGFLFGCLNAIPQHPWARGHAFHHRHNGNWERYRGPSALITCEQFLALSPKGQWRYQASRHPLMLLPGGFYYLLIRPRLQLLLGSLEWFVDLLDHLRCQGPAGLLTVPERIGHFRSSHWYTAGEFADLVANNVVVLGSWLLMGRWLGPAAFWGCYGTVMATSAALFLCIFFVQHNFEGSYARDSASSTHLEAAIEGSSNLVMPDLLNWFSADIAFHSVHHLCERIPNYHLRACDTAHSHLLGGARRLRLSDFPACFRFILWDDVSLKLRTIADLRAAAAGSA
jgi:omega-6 fatty acid desaturase (delta-12 desaturase)